MKRFCVALVFIMLTCLVLMAEPERILRFYTLSHRPASATVELIKPLLTPQGLVQVDSRLNRLIVRDTPVVLEQVEKLLEKCDIPAPIVQVTLRSSAALPFRNSNLGVGVSPSGQLRPQAQVVSGQQNSSALQTISVISGEAANISISEDNPWVLPYQSLAQRLGILPPNVVFINISTGFAVEPTVLGGGNIRMRITPWVRLPGPNGLATIAYQEASTTIEVSSGSSVTIGSSTGTTAVQREAFGLFTGIQGQGQSQAVSLTVSAQVISTE